MKTKKSPEHSKMKMTFLDSCKIDSYNYFTRWYSQTLRFVGIWLKYHRLFDLDQAMIQPCGSCRFGLFFGSVRSAAFCGGDVLLVGVGTSAGLGVFELGSLGLGFSFSLLALFSPSSSWGGQQGSKAMG